MVVPKQDEFELMHNRAKLFECLPEFEELREFEYIRQSGKFNMLTEFHQVIEEAKRLGLYNALIWIGRCQENKFSWPVAYSAAIADFEKKHGPRSQWIDDEFKTYIKKAKIRQMELELAALKEDDE
jgi:hypothetical protein